jgi:hypothetical protein
MQGPRLTSISRPDSASLSHHPSGMSAEPKYLQQKDKGDFKLKVVAHFRTGYPCAV